MVYTSILSPFNLEFGKQLCNHGDFIYASASLNATVSNETERVEHAVCNSPMYLHNCMNEILHE